MRYSNDDKEFEIQINDWRYSVDSSFKNVNSVNWAFCSVLAAADTKLGKHGIHLKVRYTKDKIA